MANAKLVFEAETGTKLDSTIEGGNLYAVRSISFSPDDRNLLIGSDDNQINIYQVFVSET